MNNKNKNESSTTVEAGELKIYGNVLPFKDNNDAGNIGNT